MEKHIPNKIVKLNKYKHKKCKWITVGIINYVSFRDKLYYKFRQQGTPEHITLKTNLTTYDKIRKKNIRAVKNVYVY